jgi:hypothetical protein
LPLARAGTLYAWSKLPCAAADQTWYEAANLIANQTGAPTADALEAFWFFFKAGLRAVGSKPCLGQLEMTLVR